MISLIQSCCRLYFINQQNDLWTMMADGRLRFIKNVPAFAGFSATGQLTGVHFVEDKTLIQQTPVDFSEVCHTLMEHKGYVYYPTFLEGRPSKLAVIYTDLLTPPGQGQLMIYERPRTKFRCVQQMPATVAPIQWDKSGTLYFLSPQKDLIQQSPNACRKLASNVACFTLNRLGTALAYYTDNKVHLITFNPKSEQSFWATNVSALAFDKNGTGLYVALFDGTKAGLCFYQPPYHAPDNFVLQNAGAVPITLMFSPLF